MSSFARATDGRLGSTGHWVVRFVRDLARGGRHVVSAAALAAFLVLPLGLTDGGYFGRALPAMTVAFVAAAGLAALSAPAREMPRGLVATALALVALTAWAGLSSLWAVPGAAVELETRRCVLYVVALLAVWRIVDRRAGPPFLLALTSTIAMLAVVGVGMRAAAGVPVDPYYGGLLAEPVGYPNAVGVLAAMGALLAIGLAARFEAAARALQATASVLVLVLGLSGSRGGALALVGGMVVLLALSPRGDRWPCVGRAASALAVGGGAWVVTSAVGGSGPPLVIAAAGAATIGAAVPTPGRRGALALLCGLTLAVGVVAVTHPPSTTSSYRIAYWAAAAAEAHERPLLGSGAGSFFLSWREHRTAKTDVRDAHSLYVETLSELGPLGLAFVLVVIGAPLGAAVRRRGDPIAAAAGAAFASFALHAGLDWDWEMPVVTLVALGCAGALLTRRSLDGGTTHS
jgi:O-antigen ligase